MKNTIKTIFTTLVIMLVTFISSTFYFNAEWNISQNLLIRSFQYFTMTVWTILNIALMFSILVVPIKMTEK